MSLMADQLEEKDKVIKQLAWKVDVLSKVILRAGVDIDDYLSIDDVTQYPLRGEAE